MNLLQTNPDADQIRLWLEKQGLTDNLTQEQIEHLSRHPSDETNTDRITRWITAIAFIQNGLRQKQTFSKETMDWYEYIKEKIDNRNS